MMLMPSSEECKNYIQELLQPREKHKTAYSLEESSGYIELEQKVNHGEVLEI
jgi:hypothetical protein